MDVETLVAQPGSGGRLAAAESPRVELRSLDTLWFQVAGTVCNLACSHCFISCSPTNHTHEHMTLAQVRGYLEALWDDVLAT